MPRSQGTSRKGKPKKDARAAGMGRALQKSQRGGGGKTFTTKNKMSGMGVKAGITGPPTAHLSSPMDLAERNMSLLELDHLDDFLVQAEMAHKEFTSEKAQFVVLDNHGSAYNPNENHVNWADEMPEQEAHLTDFSFEELSVPRRPAWDETTTPEELDRIENESFVEWRRAIAKKEEELFAGSTNNEHAYNSRTVTPYEKNLQVWRQLWRVLERCSCVVQLVDGRNPMFYLSDDLRKYAEELGKPIMLVVNKADYLSVDQRRVWSEYLTDRNWHHVFFSAHAEQAKLDKAAKEEAVLLDKQLEMEARGLVDNNNGLEDTSNEDNDNDSNQGEADPANESDTANETLVPSRRNEGDDYHGVERLLTKEELTNWMHDFAIKNGCKPNPRFENRIQFGTVGFPNVGKSSVINVLMGSSKHTHGLARVGVAAQPGKTKHFQTLLLPDRDDLMLCDCPGLVFPSFVSNTADLIAAGVYPIAQMRDHWPVIELICQRIPREIINASYGIHIPGHSAQALAERGLTKEPPPTGEEFLSTYCVARSMLAAGSGVPDYTRASRIVISDYVSGKLLYCHPPPVVKDTAAYHLETVRHAVQTHEKLRRRIESVQQHHQDNRKTSQNEEDDDSFDGDDAEDTEDAGLNREEAFDMDLLDIIGESNEVAPTNEGGRRGKAHKTRKKHGKKGRKLRDKDPYGCHKDVDEMLTGNKAPAGITVLAGKYGRKGYTRADYNGARSANKASPLAS